MKHAILILAHKDFDQLRHLIEYFIKDCFVYVHIDKKAVITSEELHSIGSMPQVRAVYQKFDIHWGGFSMLQAELWLVEKAYNDLHHDYYHLISGQDYPIKTFHYFEDFFEKQKGISFIEYQPLPVNDWSQNEQWRYRYILPFDRIYTHTTSHAKVIKWWKHQVKNNFVRILPSHFTHLYKGSQWFSLTRQAVDVLLAFTQNNPNFLRCFKNTYAPEETYVTTILANLLPKASQKNDNLRFIIWRSENGSYPAILGVEHSDALQQSPSLFARKMSIPFSAPLIRKIDAIIYE